MKKRFLSLLLCLCVFTPLLTVAASANNITTPTTPNFSDVKSDAYYATPVAWAVSKSITNGTSATTFSPDNTCTRAQILTFLWRAAGSPKSTAFLINPYVDIKEDAYYYHAALWAKEHGFVEGAEFSPDTPCTRAATVEYFWKYAGSKTVNNIPFSDVAADSELAKAVSWAVDYGVTNGTGDTTFSPSNTCTRAQIVTFLYRYFVSPLDNSAFIESVTTPSTPAAPFYDGNLDPLPPMDYRLQPDWYGTLTPVDNMSNARLVAEYDQLWAEMKKRMDQDIYMSDGPYSRELVLWSALSQRCDIVERYDLAVRRGDISERTAAAYNELIATYGDVEPLRNSMGYDL